MKSRGAVYLVGAGPGDAGLLTLRGAELLRRADVVVYDLLVNPALLKLARDGAELISRGKRKDFPQEKINELMISKAREGKCVVRLKGGDPFIFGRGGEEAETLAAAKVHFEIVPGISSIVAAPAYAGIPLTHRDFCSSFTVFTGHENSADEKINLRYDQIAKIPGTKVALMGTDKLDAWTKSLIAHGLPPETPAAVIEQGTLGKQKSVAGTLATIAKLAAEKKISPPALTILGDVVKLREKLNWFENLPLFGRRIVVTRSRLQMQKFSRKLAELGAEVLGIPAVKGVDPDNKQDFVDALLALNSYDWLVFTSPSGVSVFFNLFFRQFHDLRDLGGAKIAAVGPATAAKLREFHLQVDLMPEEFVGREIAGAFAKHGSVENLKICLLRAQNANRELPDALEEMGAIVDDIGLYKTVAETEDFFGAAADFLERGADWVTFTSGSTVQFFHARFDLPKLLKRFPQMKIASIGPETSKVIRALKLEPALEAKEHTTDGLLVGLVTVRA
ncbi:MAG TPA: uroporphyrinogen-III C-methyltransferase [Candidatus Aquilonibacter sp.]|nr:uroporphyrinogen-III C-methyltransferase [Candidatus Aquilonibacter sp.]